MDAITLYIISVFFVVALVALFFFSIHIFRRAIDMGPLRETIVQLEHKKEALLQEIGVGQLSLSKIHKEIDEGRADLQNAKNTIAEAESIKKELEDNKILLTSERKEIDENKNQIRILSNQRNVLQQEVTDLELKIQQIQEEVKNLKERKDELETRNSALLIDNERLSKITKELPEKEQLYNKLKQQINDLELEIEKLKKLKERENQAAETVKSLMDQKKHLEDEITHLKTVQSGLGVEVARLEELSGKSAKEHCWDDLDRPFFEIKERRSSISGQMKEGEWLRKLQKNLRAAGFIFNERIVKAFHTGLKTSNYSPIVILSGISGTGKSLLPQLYTTACGMNFLPIAVQPRWDSPQDMLGFYNYMEKRYKATDLARLLWQFDIFNNPEAEKYYKKQQTNLPMSVVLLDEMNIARVEYYFSDMLSKLEVRRVVDPSSPENRKAAEIAIESGASVKGLEPRRLFIGGNTLFVGTMNEDESTQSLSDKVIDRSNVLRFGKPNDLTARPDTKRFMNFYSSENSKHLSYGDWNRWIATDVTAFENVYRPISNKLNEALVKVQRPFGFRIDQSILHYIANYPGVRPDGHNEEFCHALADQIEMKILPKLNGIEKDSANSIKALDEVLQIIQSNLSEFDSELVQAFKEAKEDPASIFFKWRGVSR